MGTCRTKWLHFFFFPRSFFCNRFLFRLQLGNIDAGFYSFLQRILKIDIFFLCTGTSLSTGAFHGPPSGIQVSLTHSFPWNGMLQYGLFFFWGGVHSDFFHSFTHPSPKVTKLYKAERSREGWPAKSVSLTNWGSNFLVSLTGQLAVHQHVGMTL